MKKRTSSLLTALAILPLSACALFNTPVTTNTTLTSEQSLATLSYLSSGFLNLESKNTLNSPITSSNSSSHVLLSNPSIRNLEDNSSTYAEENLEDISIYFNRMKTFIDQGTSALGNVSTMISDRSEYAFMVTFVVNEENYVLYYSVDSTSNNLSGIMLIDDVEYTFTVLNQLDDSDDLEEFHDDNDDGIEDEVETEEEEQDEEEEDEEEDDTEEVIQRLSDDEDSEQKMEFIASNGDDTITVSYKIESEEDESTTKFEMVKFIDGITTNIEMKISQENNEYKVEVLDGTTYMEFKKETKDDEIEYKLQYSTDSIEGEIKIEETLDEFGNPVYRYKISEGGKYIETDSEKPEIKDDEEDTVIA